MPRGSAFSPYRRQSPFAGILPLPSGGWSPGAIRRNRPIELAPVAVRPGGHHTDRPSKVPQITAEFILKGLPQMLSPRCRRCWGRRSDAVVPHHLENFSGRCSSPSVTWVVKFSTALGPAEGIRPLQRPLGWFQWWRWYRRIWVPPAETDGFYPHPPSGCSPPMGV